jgi:hypothetical protein
MAAGILFSASMLFFLDLSHKAERTPLVETYPWTYVFLVVLIATVLIFFVAWEKERGTTG